MFIFRFCFPFSEARSALFPSSCILKLYYLIGFYHVSLQVPPFLCSNPIFLNKIPPFKVVLLVPFFLSFADFHEKYCP